MADPQEITQLRQQLGHTLAAYRKAASFTQVDLAPRMAYTRSTIANVERGRQNVPRRFWEKADKLLNADGELLNAFNRLQDAEQVRHINSSRTWNRSDCSDTVDSVDRRSALKLPLAAMPAAVMWLDHVLASDTISGRIQVGSSDITRLRSVIALYQGLDYQYGGGIVYRELEALSASASQLIRQHCHERLRPDLLLAVGELRLLTGWTAFDECLHSEAQRHFQAAERISIAADAPLFTAIVRYRQARQLQHLRHNADAIDLLRLAEQEVGSTGTRRVKSMLKATIACSLAALGERKAPLAYLDSARQDFEQIDPTVEPANLGWKDPAELWAQHGRVYRDLARNDPKYGDLAVKWTTRAIDSFEPEMTRSSILNQVGLCSALFLAGEPETALNVGQRLPGHARNLASKRIGDRIMNLSRDATQHSNQSDVMDFAHLVSNAPGLNP